MRAGALLTILVCELLVLMMMSLDIDSNSLSFVSTLVVVVVVAFTFSALFSNIKSLTLTKNYGVSGILGIVAGILYYWWAGDHLETMVHWLQNYGVYFLMLIIFLCALILFFYKGSSHSSHKDEVQEVKEKNHAKPSNTEGNISHTA